MPAGVFLRRVSRAEGPRGVQLSSRLSGKEKTRCGARTRHRKQRQPRSGTSHPSPAAARSSPSARKLPTLERENGGEQSGALHKGTPHASGTPLQPGCSERRLCWGSKARAEPSCPLPALMAPAER